MNVVSRAINDKLRQGSGFWLPRATVTPEALWAMGSYRFKRLGKRAEVPIANIDANGFNVIVTVD